jgi:hypothetical protein
MGAKESAIGCFLINAHRITPASLPEFEKPGKVQLKIGVSVAKYDVLQ